MDLDFDLVLFCILSALGLIIAVDIFLYRLKLAVPLPKISKSIIGFAREFFPILFLVFLFRAFVYEPRYIPSGSLKPTLLAGDFVLVNKFTYGIRLPVTHTKIFEIGAPKRGDIVVFRGPEAYPKDLVKRVIGAPGDRISYQHKTLYINGVKIPQQFKQMSIDQNDSSHSWNVTQNQENLFGLRHDIFLNPDSGEDDFHAVAVPAGNYFMMGDNRDNSADSRAWGFMPEANIIGRATHVIMSVESYRNPVRWSRLGEKIT